MWRQCLVNVVGGRWWGLIVFTTSQNRPYTHPRHPQIYRGLAELDASRLVLADIGRWRSKQSDPRVILE
jgi:hypothetical protein